MLVVAALGGRGSIPSTTLEVARPPPVDGRAARAMAAAGWQGSRPGTATVAGRHKDYRFYSRLIKNEKLKKEEKKRNRHVKYQERKLRKTHAPDNPLSVT